MFKRFSEQFATTDFDQEMLDYIAEHYAYEDSEWNVEDDCLVYGTGLCCFWTDNSYSEQSFCTLTKQEFKAKIGMPLETKPTIDVYTTQELAYIKELEDEVNRLNDLCSDYAKIIEDKDAEIFQLKHQALRVASETVLGVEQQFKPISEMTISDWQQALKEGWEFEDDEGDVCVVEAVDSHEELVGFDEYMGKFNIRGEYCDNDYQFYIVKRIK